MNRIPWTKCKKTCKNAHGLSIHMGKVHKIQKEGEEEDEEQEEEENESNDESLIDSDVGSDIEAKNK